MSAVQCQNKWLEGVTDGIAVYNRQGECIFSNPFADKLLGGWRNLSSEDKSASGLPSPLVSDAGSHTLRGMLSATFYRECGRAIARQNSVCFQECCAPLKSWLEIRAYPTPDGLTVLFLDITERKRTEVSLQSENDALEHQLVRHALKLRQTRMTLFTAALERQRVETELQEIQTQYTRLQQQAEELIRLKDEFLNNLSHELRTPLQGILVWTHLLQRRVFEEDVLQRGISTIERQSKALHAVIRDLLDLSQIVTGKFTLHPEWLNLAEVAERAIASLQLAAEAKFISVQLEVAPDLPQVHGDAHALHQVIWHLLSNAIKFTPNQGEVWLRLSHQGQVAHVEVSDTGQGIEAQFLPKVFDRFRQEDGSITRSFGGLGLGLSLVKYLVELHGGTIKILSAGHQKGTRAIVKLPAPVIEEGEW